MKPSNMSVFFAMLIVGAFAFSGCGGSSSSGDPAAAPVDASVENLASIPSLDLSNYDASSGSNANLAVPPKSLSKSVIKAVSKSVAKAFGENMNAVGNSSRAGCEANMHKQEVFRMSQQAQLDRCYPEAMETAGFITIPVGSYAYYKIVPPEDSAEDRAKKCEGIPEQMIDEKAQCIAGGEGAGGQMRMRIGRIDGALMVDMCEGAVPALLNESSYTALGSLYTANVTHIGNWNGHEEKGKFQVEVDLGTTGSVTNGLATLGADSSLDAEGWMSGGFGSGHIKFEYVGTDGSNKITGAFGGDFTDPFSNMRSVFEGKSYAQFGGATATGCAKYLFSGKMPGMIAGSMIPYDIGEADKANFLATWGAQLGLVIEENTVLCPNPNFKPNDTYDPLIKPMVLPSSEDGLCPEVAHSDVECFSITNVETAGNFGETGVSQYFTIIADDGSPYFADVNAFVVTDISKETGTIAFVRNWDCEAPSGFTSIEFTAEGMTPEQMQVAESAIGSCKAIEEAARGNQGMGGYDCGEKEQANAVDGIASGGGGSEDFGPYGGKWEYSNLGGTCPEEIISNGMPYVFVSPIDIQAKSYCVPMPGGSCAQFTVADNNIAADLDIDWNPSVTITQIIYEGAQPEIATVYLTVPPPSGNCTAKYNKVDTSFQREGSGFGPPGGEGGEQGMPQACITAGLTDPAACQQLCMQPSDPCSPN